MEEGYVRKLSNYKVKRGRKCVKFNRIKNGIASQTTVNVK